MASDNDKKNWDESKDPEKSGRYRRDERTDWNNEPKDISKPEKNEDEVIDEEVAGSEENEEIDEIITEESEQKETEIVKLKPSIFSILFMVINSAIILCIGLIFIVSALGMDNSGNILPKQFYQSGFYWVIAVIASIGVLSREGFGNFKIGSKDSSGRFRESMDMTDQVGAGCMSMAQPFAVGAGLALIPYYILFWLAGLVIQAFPYILTGLIGVIAITIVVFNIILTPNESGKAIRSLYHIVIFVIFGGILLIVLPKVSQTKAFMKIAGTYDNKIEKLYLAGDFELVKGGTFMMGSVDEFMPENVRPVHEVEVSDFYLGKYEVSLKQFYDFIEDSGYITTAEKNGFSYIFTGQGFEKKNGINWRYDGKGDTTYFSWGKDEFPVVHISKTDALAFCEWLERQTGKTYRLPTEAEWEYAARDGRKNKDREYSGSNNDKKVAWYEGSKGRRSYRPHKIGQKKKSKLGFYDMSGNVRELCSDYFDYYSDTAALQVNPTGPENGEFLSVRGGGFNSTFREIRVSARDSIPISYTSGDLGFRIVRVIEEEPSIYKVLFNALFAKTKKEATEEKSNINEEAILND